MIDMISMSAQIHIKTNTMYKYVKAIFVQIRGKHGKRSRECFIMCLLRNVQFLLVGSYSVHMIVAGLRELQSSANRERCTLSVSMPMGRMKYRHLLD